MTDQAKPRILSVDDDVELTAMLDEYLSAEGFVIDAMFNGEDAVAPATSGRYDAVILDVMLPRLSGLEALRRIRQESMVPVLVLTAKGDNIDRVVGLELGADDYVPKPYFPRELVARLRAVMRRRPRSEGGTALHHLRLGNIEVDVPARRVRCDRRSLDLTLSEFDLLVALMSAGDRAVSKDELSLQVLGRQRTSYDRSVDVHVSNLRRKLESDCSGSILIETVRGFGYRIRNAR